MKLLYLIKSTRWLTSVVLLPLLSACAAVPGLSVIADLNDFQSIQKRGVFNVPDDELRAIEERELPNSTGLSYDLGLLRRSTIQVTRGNLAGLRQTRALAMRHGTNQERVVEVRILAAFGERMFLNHRAAKAELEADRKSVV